ncbi:MAG: tRNA G18 (ribose-2'-O)-methylase SpoU [Candidatus Poriferisodalaceae bacterium]
MSLGEGFESPYAWLPNMVEGLADVKESGIEILALTPMNDSVDIAGLSYSSDDRVALLLGAEGPGLTPQSMQAASRRVKIPMSGSVDSMNVGNAAAIAFYALRQARVS